MSLQPRRDTRPPTWIAAENVQVPHQPPHVAYLNEAAANGSVVHLRDETGPRQRVPHGQPVTPGQFSLRDRDGLLTLPASDAGLTLVASYYGIGTPLRAELLNVIQNRVLEHETDLLGINEDIAALQEDIADINDALDDIDQELSSIDNILGEVSGDLYQLTDDLHNLPTIDPTANEGVLFANGDNDAWELLDDQDLAAYLGLDDLDYLPLAGGDLDGDLRLVSIDSFSPKLRFSNTAGASTVGFGMPEITDILDYDGALMRYYSDVEIYGDLDIDGDVTVEELIADILKSPTLQLDGARSIANSGADIVLTNIYSGGGRVRVATATSTSTALALGSTNPFLLYQHAASNTGRTSGSLIIDQELEVGGDLDVGGAINDAIGDIRRGNTYTSTATGTFNLDIAANSGRTLLWNGASGALALIQGHTSLGARMTLANNSFSQTLTVYEPSINMIFWKDFGGDSLQDFDLIYLPPQSFITFEVIEASSLPTRALVTSNSSGVTFDTI